MTAPEKPSGVKTLLGVALGALVLQASYHTGRRQGIGMAAALAPVAALRKTAEGRREVLERHVAPMNTNPAMAGVLLGSLARLEDDARSGSPGAADRAGVLRRTLEGPLAATGDALLWAGLRPASALAGGIVSWFLGAAGIVVFLTGYNLIHLGLRVGGVFWGYARGIEAHRILRARWIHWGLRVLPWAVAAGGLGLVLLAASTSGPPGWTVGPAAAAGALLGRRGVSHGGLLAGGAIVTGLLLAFVAGS